MLVPIFCTISPKTLLKWTTPQSKRATKFKTKTTKINSKPITTKKVNKALTLICPTTTAFETIATTTTTATTIVKQYNFLLKASSSFSSSSLSFKSSIFLSLIVVVTFCISIFKFNAQFLLRTVIKNLTSLMNDIRTKSRYLTTTTKTISNKSTLISTSSSSSSSSSAASHSSIDYNNKNNHRTYNNSSKSNKVFLYYTPRDPHLRILFNFNLNFNEQPTFLVESFNKHLVLIESDSDSELKITEDLCQYGELIGGNNKSISEINNSNNNCKQISNNHNNNNKQCIRNNSNDNQIINKNNSCDFIKSVCDKSANRLIVSPAIIEFGENFKALEQKHQEQQQQQLLKTFKNFAQGIFSNFWSSTIKATFIAGGVL